MADEITVTGTLKVVNSSLFIDKTISDFVTMTGDAYQHGIQEIGTSEEQITITSDIGTYGFVLVVNRDATNYVEIGAVTAQYAIKVKAGEVALFRPAANALYAKADTAACDLEFWIVED